MQICTLIQTHNHASIPPLSFLQAGCPSCCPTNSVKALKAETLKAEALYTHTHNHFTALWILSGTTRVSRYQKKHGKLDNNLCKCRGTMQRILSLIATKATFKLIQRHWYSCHLIDHIWLPISLPLKLCPYLVPLGHVTNHAHKGVSGHPKTTNLIQSTCVQNLMTAASVVPELWLGTLKFKIGHVTMNMPIWGRVCHPKADILYGQSMYNISNLWLWLF